MTRAAIRVLPERITHTPLAYHARRHHGIHEMRARELKSVV